MLDYHFFAFARLNVSPRLCGQTMVATELRSIGVASWVQCSQHATTTQQSSHKGAGTQSRGGDKKSNASPDASP